MNDVAIINDQTLIVAIKARVLSFMRRIDVDRVVLFAILARVWGFAAGPVTALLIVRYFTPTVQGYYYTFGPVLGLQIFLELGIGFAIAQFASHEWANLRIGENGFIVGDPDSLSRLSSLVKFAIKWYSVASIIVVIGLSIGGYVFFSQSPTQNINWQLPWISLCIMTGISFLLIPIWSLLEGCNQVSNVYRFRLVNVLLSSVAIWVSIMLGGLLWTTSIMILAGHVYAAYFLYKHYRNFFRTFYLSKIIGPRLSWVKDILPLQWRVALAWVVGYFLTSLFVPVLFHYHGPDIAGRMGLTWALVSALQGICAAWVSPKVPQLAIWAKQEKYDEMDRTFFKQLKVLFIISFLGAATIWTGVFMLYKFDHSLSYRLLPPLPTAIFLITGVLHAMTLPMSLYLIAHKKMPFLSASILAGVISGAGSLILGKLFSAMGVSIAYLSAYLVALPLTFYIWKDCRKKWHHPYEEELYASK